jgi:hypothetical protein
MVRANLEAFADAAVGGTPYPVTHREVISRAIKSKGVILSRSAERPLPEQPSRVPDAAFDKQKAIQAEAKNLCIFSPNKCIDPSASPSLARGPRQDDTSNIRG